MTKPETIICEIYDAWRADLEWLASYLPDDFCHIIHIPQDIHPLGGVCRGKAASIARLGVIADDFEFLLFDTSGLIVHEDMRAWKFPFATGTGRPGARSRQRSPISGRSRTAGRSSSPNITTSSASRLSASISPKSFLAPNAGPVGGTPRSNQ